MRIHMKASCFVLLGAASVLAGCATTRPVAYQGLESSAKLQPNDQGKHGHEPFVYNTPAVDWHRYTSFILDPVTIYQGPDQQFEKISDDDKSDLANYMQAQFEQKLRQRYSEASVPDTSTLRIKLTLTGAKRSTTFISSFAKVDMGGGPYNAVQAMRGREGAFTGSVSYAVEIYDASTNQLLKAYVDKQYPNAMNMKATFGALSASKTGIQKGADSLLDNLK
jgi:hypothetical protein